MMNLPYHSRVCSTPGTPKPSSVIHRITGMPRTMSMYSVAEQPHRVQRRRPHAPADGDQQPEHDDARRAPQEDLDVVPERPEQLGEDRAERLGVEERLLDALPARRLGDQPDEQADDDGRAQRGGGDAPAPLAALVALAAGAGRADRRRERRRRDHSSVISGRRRCRTSTRSVMSSSAPDVVEGGEGEVGALDERVVLGEQQAPRLALVAVAGRELAEHLGALDLDAGDVQRRRQVGDDGVDLLGVEGLLGRRRCR